MGICAGKAEDQEKNRQINKELMDERKRLDNEIKLLLLG